MKKLTALTLAVITLLCCLVSCNEGDKYNRERFYGVVRYLEEYNHLVVYIPNLGDVTIPKSEGYCTCFDGHDEDTEQSYQLKPGDLVAITFRYEKSWDDNSVRILETYPARFDRQAHLIEVLKENISFTKTDSGYVLSFPSTAEIESAEIGDTLYFIQHGGENGRAYEKLYASGQITAKADGINTVALTIPEGESEFLNYYNEMTVELTWGEYKPNEEKAMRVYMFRDSERLVKPKFFLYEDGTFQMTFSAESSYDGIGTYTLTDGRLTLKTDDGNYTYCFDAVGNTYVFDAKASSDMVWFSDMIDGCVFE